LHDHIISLRGEIRAHKTSLTLPIFIDVPVPSQESEAFSDPIRALIIKAILKVVY
jgi:vacuolar-type H+-ATPase subunit F/Vma7